MLIIAFAVLVYLIIKYSVSEMHRSLLGPIMIPIASVLAVIMLVGICYTIHNIKRK